MRFDFRQHGRIQEIGKKSVRGMLPTPAAGAVRHGRLVDVYLPPFARQNPHQRPSLTPHCHQNMTCKAGEAVRSVFWRIGGLDLKRPRSQREPDEHRNFTVATGTSPPLPKGNCTITTHDNELHPPHTATQPSTAH
uniref:Uncharacterized protein n=1 Tax=Eutreptiella gymnastica TaxID=73025 RepID=A0A7S4CFP7_9EUGL